MIDWHLIRNALREELAHHVDPKKIAAFLGQCTIIEKQTNPVRITIGVPSEFFLAQIKKFFDQALTDAAKLVIDPECIVQYRVDASLLQDIPKQASSPVTSTKRQPERYQTISELFGVIFESKYQFDNFIVWSHNEFAASIWQAIAAQPWSSYNPFFLYGNAWLGKTHLLQAIANKIMARDAKKVVVYLPATKLIDHIIWAIKKNKLSSYLKQFENVDVLILDDVQFLAWKDKTQEIFLGIFNDFVERNKQIILSWDRSPKELTIIEPRLRTRFGLGVLCDVKPPNIETRLAILQSKCEIKKISLSISDQELIASSITDNIREIEGITTTLSIKSQLMWREIVHDDVINALDTMWYSPKQIAQKSFDHVIKAIADAYEIQIADMLSDTRKQWIVKARNCAMYCAKNRYWWTLERIWDYFGGKHHTSVMHGIQSFEEILKHDDAWYQSIYQQFHQ